MSENISSLTKELEQSKTREHLLGDELRSLQVNYFKVFKLVGWNSDFFHSILTSIVLHFYRRNIPAKPRRPDDIRLWKESKIEPIYVNKFSDAFNNARI